MGSQLGSSGLRAFSCACAVPNRRSKRSISFAEPALPLSSGTGLRTKRKAGSGNEIDKRSAILKVLNLSCCLVALLNLFIFLFILILL